MIIAPNTIEQDGPGIELENQPAGLSVKMADPVADFEYALNKVTLTWHLTGAFGVRLKFEAMEFGDEPHASPPGPFGNEANFDGVALSVDGAAWYEIQDLRSLRSDRFTAYDLDLDAKVAGLGLAYGSAVRIRFCQYDNNPAPKDGIFIKGIELSGEPGPILYLPMDDNAATPVVTDAAAGHHDQTFVDPGGNPNTTAHSVAGMVGTALYFDGVDDRIDLGTTVDGALTSGHDFAIVFWWARGEGNTQNAKHIFYKPTQNGSIFAYNTYVNIPYILFNIILSISPEVRYDFLFSCGYVWNHYVLQRRGSTFEMWVNGALVGQDTRPENTRDFSGPGGFVLGGPLACRGTMDDFRVYDRALSAVEITALQ